MSERVRLERIFYGAAVTLGLLEVAGRLLYTAEDPWLDNRPNASCIPDGVYRCRPRQFFRGGYPAVEITGVPGRSTILFHRGNTAADVSGCVVVGLELAAFPVGVGVANSAGAWKVFHPALGSIEFDLEIVPRPPLSGTTHP